MIPVATQKRRDIFNIRLPPHPYPGLRPFEKQEWPIFFGREKNSAEAIGRVIDKQFLALHGDSGCGKSSLIRAGVMPRLERDHARGGATWRTTAMLPRNAPLRNMAVALAELDGNPPDPDRVIALRRLLNLGAEAATPLSSALLKGEHDYICLLVDQFEEVFDFAKSGGSLEAQQFLNVLAGLQRSRPPGLHVILTMRSEYLGACARFDGLAEVINDTQFLLPRMDHEALLRAICEPATLYGGTVTRELAEAIIASSGWGQDQLPLMQHAMMLLHRRVAGTGWTLGLNDFNETGGVAKLLSDHAESVIAPVLDGPPGKARILEKAFRALTGFNADGLEIRRPQSISQLRKVTGDPSVEATATDLPVLMAVLEPLCADGVSFLKIFGSKPYDENELVDISHEALIRNWTRLREWTHLEAEDGAFYQRLWNFAKEHQSKPDLLFSLWEARDKERWWLTFGPTQAWAERYGGQGAQLPLKEIKDLIDRSRDRQQQDFSSWREQLQDALKLWDGEKQPDRLLQGYQLSQAEDWIGKRRERLGADEIEFIAQSAGERDRVMHERVSEVAAREEAQHEALLNARRVVRRTAAGLAASLILAVLAGGVGVFAIKQRAIAEDGQKLAYTNAVRQITAQQNAADAARRDLDLALKARDDLTLALEDAQKKLKERDLKIAQLEKILSISDTEKKKLEAALEENRLAEILKQASNANDHNDYAGALKLILAEFSGTLVTESLSPPHKELLKPLRVAVQKAPILYSWTGGARDPDLSIDREGQNVLIPEVHDRDQKLRVWSPGPASPIESAPVIPGDLGAISPDGRQVLSYKLADRDLPGDNAAPARSRFRIGIWDVGIGGAQSSTEKFALDRPGLVIGSGISLSWAPDGSKVAVAYGTDTAEIFDAGSGRKVQGMRMPEAGPSDGYLLTLTSALISPPDSRWVLGLGRLLSTARLFDLSTGKVRLLYRDGHILRRGLISTAAFSSDGERIITGGQDGRAVIWDTTSDQPGPPIQHDDFSNVKFAMFSGDGQRVVTAANSEVRISSVVGKKATTIKIYPIDGRIVWVQYLNARSGNKGSEDRIFVVTANGKAFLLSKTGELLWSMNFPAETQTAVYLTASDSFITSSDSGTIRLWSRQVRERDIDNDCKLLEAAHRLSKLYFPAEPQQDRTCK